MHMSLNGEEHVYIFIQLDCIRCFKDTKFDCA
jgi:hypothetical protein